MRILLLMQFFDPEPQPRGLVFAKALKNAGHEVEVLTGFPNYPGGKIYEGHEVSVHRKEDHDGVVVHRVALYPSHDRSAVRRIANYGSFALSAAFVGPSVVTKPDVVFVYHPPLTISVPAATLKLLWGVPFVYEVQDLWPDTLRATGMIDRAQVLAIIGWWARQVYRVADRVTVISPGFRNLLIERGVRPDKVEVVPNWTEEDRFTLEPRDPALVKTYGLEGRFNVMFAGTMGIAQGLDAVLDAAKISQQRTPRAQYVFVGGGVDKARLEAQSQELGLDNVVFLPRQPLEAMGRILPLADALLVHLRDDPLFAITVPSKTQAYLWAGVPVIMAMRGDAADMVEAAKAGVVCTPEDPASIADAVHDLASRSDDALRELGRSGRAYYDEQLSLRVGVQRYINMFQRLAGVS